MVGQDQGSFILAVNNLYVQSRFLFYPLNQFQPIVGGAHGRCGAGPEAQRLIGVNHVHKSMHGLDEFLSDLAADGSTHKGVVPQAQGHADQRILNKTGITAVNNNPGKQQAHGIAADING